ncbi:cobalt-precorrin-5B (C(1))-methyltransferase [Pleurocapsales cyanobacterium LEGE 06147]|nr:cobalt-precorrin-5B (C(1))-methyltransferase [Pleurocapsales cyanobacterium LEGE 06147]
MNASSSGYTLPVFACAAAIAALRHLQQKLTEDCVTVNLINPSGKAAIPIEQVAKLNHQSALAITRSDPGDHLDLTRHTPVWAMVELIEQQSISLEKHQRREDKEEIAITNSRSPLPQCQIEIIGGEGIGHRIDNKKQAAIYSYARQLLYENLFPLLRTDEKIAVTIILPEGRKLAERTSNEAFGIVEGLSLLGTTGIVQPLTAPGQLEIYQAQLREKAAKFDSLVFCIGENGVDLAQRLGIDPQRLIKTANWLGSMLVVAGVQRVKSVLLFGYHGKMIKLAGGIFHTHHHLADGRLEILTAHCARLGLPSSILRQIFDAPTTEAALQILQKLDQEERSHWVEQIYSAIAAQIDRRSQGYIRKHTEQEVCIGSVLFDRQRRILIESSNAVLLLRNLC